MPATQRRSRKTHKWESYLLGIASLFDFTGALRRPRHTLQLPSPNDSLSGDWQAIGADIQRALHRFATRPSE